MTTSIHFPDHAPIHAFDRVGGELVIGGVPLSRLAARIGRTPFYAYSREAISARVAELRAALPEAVRLHYAMKANPMPALVAHLVGLTDGIDVASAQEMHVALDAGADPGHMSFAGPGKTPEEISRAIAAGVAINLESEGQYRAALVAAETLGIAPRLAIRINPAFELKSSGMQMGGGPKPFGIDEELVPGLVARMCADGVPPVGLHIYSGSQNLRADAIIEAQRNSVSLGIRLAAQLPDGLEWLNIGGGFGVPYFPGEAPLDVGRIGEALAPLCEEAARHGVGSLVLELGRYLVAEAGVYVTRVLDRKVSRDRTFLVVDGGLHHNLAASGNFGQVLRKNYPVAIGNRLDAQATEPQTVVGPLCTPLDLLADRMALAPAQPGDFVVVFMAGAYGLSASPTRFLSHPEPAEALV